MSTEAQGSPKSKVEAMATALRLFDTEEGRVKGLGFKPRSDDVFVVTHLKCGTTWMQQIMHGLRSRGSMDFEEIDLAIPCVELAYDYGYGDLHKPQGFLPRMYKTHAWYPHCPKGAGKYVFVIRHPHDAAVSFFEFLNRWFFPKDSITIEDYIAEFYCKQGEPKDVMQRPSYWHFLASWFPHRHDESVLWLHYEDMKEDLRGCIDLVAQFLGIGADDSELKSLVEHQASFEFMKEHVSQFDEHVVKESRNAACGLPPDAGMFNTKVRSGIGRNELPATSTKLLDDQWESIVLPATGYKSYDDLRSGVNKELGRSSRFGNEQ